MEQSHSGGRIPPVNLQETLSAAIAHHQAGRLSEAVALYRELLAANPNDAAVLNNLGEAMRLTGDLVSAEQYCRRAVAAAPGLPLVHFNLGIVLLEAKRHEEAAAAFRQTIALDPTHAAAFENLGLALADLNRPGEALAQYSRAIGIEPLRGSALFKVFSTIYAMSSADPALARSVAERFLAAFPDHAILRRGLCGLAGGTASSEGDTAYTTMLFDRFAAEFDQVLAALGYAMPERLAEVVGALGGAPASLDILDLGCGTGLCGVQLKPLARQLVGVDLSSEMLAKATARGIYDVLAQEDAAKFMRANPGAYDVAVAADVLIYIGDLTALAEALARALRPGGTFAFSAERLDAPPELAFRLAPSGRYQHAGAYLETVFANAGFTLSPLLEATVRMEKNTPVPGWIVSGRLTTPGGRAGA